MPRILSGNRNIGVTWRRLRGGGGFRPRQAVIPRRSIRTMGKTDPSTGQGSDFPRLAQLVPAALTQVLAGANNDVRFTAKFGGLGSNSIRVAFVNPGGTVGRTITVAGNDITVNLAVTAGAINATETAASIVASINADAAANKLVTAATAEGDGTGVVAAFALTNLTGGAENFTKQRDNTGVSLARRLLRNRATAPGTGVERIPGRGTNKTLERR